MNPQSMSFIFGAILLAVAILGGGFEVKEIKVSNVSISVRIIAGIVGLIFIGLGFWQLPSALTLSELHPKAQGRGHLGFPHGLRQSRTKPSWLSRYPSSLIATASTSVHSICQHQITKRLSSVTVESG